MPEVRHFDSISLILVVKVSAKNIVFFGGSLGHKFNLDFVDSGFLFQLDNLLVFGF